MKTFYFISIITLILIYQVNPAQAATQNDTVRLLVENRTGEEVDLTLSGPTNLKASIKEGKTTLHLLPGLYTYSYRGCGRNFTGTVRVSQDRQLFQLTRCSHSIQGGAQSDNSFVVIQNKSNQSVTVTLKGLQIYKFDVGANAKKRVEVVKGHYSFLYNACGDTKVGTLGTSHLDTILEIPKCPTGTGPGEPSNGGTLEKTVVLFIENKTDAPLSFILKGPRTYYVNAPVGKTKLIVVKGTYNWHLTSTACSGGEDDGNINLNRSISWTWSCKEN